MIDYVDLLIIMMLYYSIHQFLSLISQIKGIAMLSAVIILTYTGHIDINPKKISNKAWSFDPFLQSSLTSHNH